MAKYYRAVLQQAVAPTVLDNLLYSTYTVYLYMYTENKSGAQKRELFTMYKRASFGQFCKTIVSEEPIGKLMKRQVSCSKAE